jgi:HAE1 family hydrophobic/amphiphilic exporter-1
MEQITQLSIRRPLTMLMIILGMVVMGYRGYTFLAVERWPEVDFPIVSITTVFPGASPEDVEELIVKPIEDAVAGISGIDELTSNSREGMGSVVIRFLEGVDGDQAAIDVERQVSRIRDALPEDAGEPAVVKADLNALPILQLVLSGPQGQDALFEIADDEIKTRLQAIEGVASIFVLGGREREIQVNVDPDKLVAFDIALADVQRALAANNIKLPAGSIDEGRNKTSIRSMGEFKSLDEIKNIVVAGGPNDKDRDALVYLYDIATVSEGLPDQDTVIRYNGLDAVNISVVKAGDANTLETADTVKKAIEEINARDLPAGASIAIVIDDSVFVRESVEAVEEDLMMAVLITGVVMLIFLHTIRSTFIVLLAIPTSIISTFFVMWILGYSLNGLTLLALTLVIGILVDDSIVVLENIERHLKMKKPRHQAALEGRAEIGLAAVTITLVDVVVYVPVAFTSGIIGQFFRSYGITIAVATLFSLFVSFTLTPMLASMWMKDESQPETEPAGLRKFFGVILGPVDWFWHKFIGVWERAFVLLAELYGKVLRLTLLNAMTQGLAVVIAIGSLVGGVYLVVSGVVGTEFIPIEDDAQFRVNVTMPPGTNLETTDAVARQIEQLILAEVPETVSILTRAGGSSGNPFGGGGGGVNLAQILVRIVDKEERSRTTVEVVEQLRPLVRNIPDATIALNVNASAGGGGNVSPIQVQVAGNDPNTLIELASEVEGVMKTVPGTVDIINNDAARSIEAQLVIDRDRALNLGLSPAQMATTLRTAVSGSEVGKFKPGGDTEVDIILRLAEESRQDINALMQTPIGYLDGQPIILDQIATLRRQLAPATITRSERQRVLRVGSGVAGGAASGDVADAVEAALKAQVSFPPGYQFEFIGEAERQREAMQQLVEALLLSIVLIYMLLVALYQSWLQPLAIMLSLPVTLVGAFGGLLVTGNTLNIISMMGIILLTGVVTKNAILLVDFTNLLREEQGLSRKEALIEAGRLRLRPILMTTLSLVFALLPLLLGTGAGSESRAPLAAVVIGGNISSTLLTLILIPVVYNFFDWFGGGLAYLVKLALGGVPPGEGEQESPRLAPQPGGSSAARSLQGPDAA